jgi:hypothetical protein
MCFHNRQGLLVRSVLETEPFSSLLPRTGVVLEDDVSFFIHLFIVVVIVVVVAPRRGCPRVHGIVRSGFQRCAHRRKRVGGQVVARRRQFSHDNTQKLPLEFTGFPSCVLILIFLIDVYCVPALLISSILKKIQDLSLPQVRASSPHSKCIRGAPHVCCRGRGARC